MGPLVEGISQDEDIFEEPLSFLNANGSRFRGHIAILGTEVTESYSAHMQSLEGQPPLCTALHYSLE